MNTTFSVSRKALVCAALLAAVAQAPAGVTDLATAPLQTSTATLVKPNIFFVLDDSGSMDWDYSPDWANDYSGVDSTLFYNSKFNGVYYDPAVTYTPPMKYDGSSYNSMNAGNTSNWTSVPDDGFGVQSTNYSDLTGSAVFYTFIPGEFCAGRNLRSCNTQSSANSSYPYPAYLRWCTTTALTTCQAAFINVAPSGGSTYTNPRYPGATLSAPVRATATISFSGSSSTSLSSIKVNGIEIMSGGTSASSTSSTVASRVASAINACTSAVSGSCGVAGYQATRSGSTITIYSPVAQPINTYTPAITKSGSMTVTVSSFSGGANGVYAPGSSVKTTITSSTSSYPYPGTSAKAETRSDCSGTTCTYAEEMTNYANWWAYYHTRMQMMKTSASIAFNGMDSRFRLGYMSINNNTSSDFLNIADVSTAVGGQKSKWYSKFVAAIPNNSTPLRTALTTAGRYYSGKLTKVNNQTAVDPMQYACQRDYTILSTDGYWNESANPFKVDGTTEVGDFDGNGTANTLSDVAKYYYDTDIRSSTLGTANNASGVDVSSNNFSNKQQRMTTYTLGLGASGYMQYFDGYATATSGDYYDVSKGTTTNSTTQANGICIWQTSGACTWPAAVNNTQTTIDDLWHAADVAGGTYYSATNPAELQSSLTNVLNSVTADYSSAAAATLSSPNLSATTASYVYGTNFCSAKWFGELAKYSIDAADGHVTATPIWAVSGAGDDCENASGGTTKAPLLDQTPYASRLIYTYNSAATNTLIPFEWSSLTSTMQSYFKVSAISSLAQMCASGATCLPSSSKVDSTGATAPNNVGLGGYNLVNFLRGDRSNEGSTNTKYYFPRTHVLGDIVNSAATYVGSPVFSYIDTGYSTYKTNNSAPTARQGVVYAGANDGMLHAFSASDGAELWAYIPSILLPKLYKLADKNYASNHVFLVDGPITKADAYFNSSWHTILVGGLGRGGRGFYALDVTSPTTPKVLWEFTSDSSKSSPYITDEDLGYSYGAPVVTKLSDGTWVVLVTSGYNNVYDSTLASGAGNAGSGHGILWVLNAQTGAIIKKIDTGIGTASGTIFPTGCTVQPCPSGLTKIAAWVDSPANNTSPQVYGGDLYGNLWRFDISKLTASGGTATVQLLTSLADPSGTRQPITTTPELGYISGNHIVYVGTGGYLGISDIPSTQVQSIYAIKDPLTTKASATTPVYTTPHSNTCSASSSTTDCFMKQNLSSTTPRSVTSSMTYPMNFAVMNGWYIDLPVSAERVNVDPTLQLGTLIFVTNVPSSANACAVGGSSYLNYVNYRTGLTVPGATDAGTVLSSTGLASAASLALTTDGKPIAIVKTSDGQTVVLRVPSGSSAANTRRLSWRELIVGQ